MTRVLDAFGPAAAAFDAVAERHGLGAAMTEAVVAALLPAFTLGLQQAMRDPEAARRALALIGGEPLARSYAAAAAAAPEAVRERAAEALAAVIGSPRVQKAIAAQAAAQANVAQAVIEEMMPAVAGALVEGLAHEQGKALDAWARLMGLAPEAAPQAQAPQPAALLAGWFALGRRLQEAQFEAYRRILSGPDSAADSADGP
jgi:hypothetical protein